MIYRGIVMKKGIGTSFKIMLLILMVVVETSSILSQVNDTTSEEKQLKLTGSISFNSIGYYVDGISYRSDPFSNVLSGNISLKYKQFELPLSFILADKQQNYAQSFNQLGISPTWRWIKVHAGYRSVNFSSFTMAGHTFLGGGIELTPGIFRFGIVGGQFNRSTTSNTNSKVDPLPNFQRKGFAGKIGIGSKKNYFDIIFLRIRDDENSLDQPDSGYIRTPAQNIVAGFKSLFTFFKGKLTWDSESAISLTTLNLWAAEISDLEEDSRYSRFSDFLCVNQSSEYYTAFRTALNYRAKTWSLKGEYKRIAPRYNSMGAYFISNDLENITLSPSLSLLKRKLRLSGSIGLQRDNLRGTKMATSKRTIGNAFISYNPKPKFGIDASYSNYSFKQEAGRLPINDTTRMQQGTHNFSLTQRFFLIKPERSHMIMLTYNMSALRDKNEFTADMTRFTIQTVQLNYILSLNQRRWSINLGSTYTNSDNYFATITNISGTAGISKTLLENKLTLGWNNSLTRRDNPSDEAWIFNSYLNSNYRINKHNSFRLYIYFTGNYNDPGTLNPTYNELKGDFSYVYTF